MEIKLEQPITSLRGMLYLNMDGTAMTLKDALLEQVGGYRAKSGAETIKAYALGQKVLQANGSIVLSSDEISLIQSAFDQTGLPSAIAGFVLEMFNNK